MKCPKCDYLGFETGDRCKNCGYDFSLLAPHVPPSAAAVADPSPAPGVSGEPELELHVLDTYDKTAPATDVWLDRLDETLPSIDASTGPPHETTGAFMDADLAAPPTAPLPRNLPGSEEREPSRARGVSNLAPAQTDVGRPDATSGPRMVVATARQFAEPALPLFRPDAGDDAPLISAARPPRPPLSVRKTPDRPKLRALPKPVPQSEPEPALEFPEPAITLGDAEQSHRGRPHAKASSHSAPHGELSSPGRRLCAAAIDHAILLLIDMTVVYFTLRMAMLEPGEWSLLPPLPFLAFLAMITLSYFWAFTAIGGQTIGKMALRIRVVGDDDRVPPASQSARRTLVGAVSLLTFGLGFLPALLGDRRALHDRVARTRVISA